jgi:ribosome biogenesis GTPase / thiamine phosphate phosphatase
MWSIKKSTFGDHTLKHGRIIEQISNQYQVLMSDETLIKCQARGKLRHMKLDQSSTFYQSKSQKTKQEQLILQVAPKVGDIVLIDETKQPPQIIEIMPRTSDLYRPDIANVNQVLLTFSFVEPAFNTMLLDKFLTLFQYHGLEVTLIMTKRDLADDKTYEEIMSTLKYYEKMGYQILLSDLKSPMVLHTITPYLNNKISVVAGQTGVGKSTLLNMLMPEAHLKTQAISKALGRGKHTTRHTTIYPIGGGYVADTPGFSKLDLMGIKKELLKDYFVEFNQAPPCKFSSCLHIHEPSCGVKDAVSKGEILISRYEHYVTMYEDIKQQKAIY